MIDFNTAVKKAMQGDSESFAYLYNSTYYNMLYLAMKYVKNQSDAEDILQDAYLKAQLNMGMLHEPEKFKSWLGCIVANTALNYLKKKKPLVFSAVGGEDNNGQSFIYDIQDDNDAYQPEKAYSHEEIKNLVREMVDSLSDEQRMCVMMYHFDGQSIKDIADSMGCSENTVKSRLYYGRNALRKKMEALKEKGYQLYSFAPIPFLMYLLKAEKALPETQKIAKAAMDKRADNDKSKESELSDKTPKNDVSVESTEQPINEVVNEPVNQTSVTSSTVETIRIATVSTTLKAFLATATGKVTAAVLAAVIVGGTAAGVNIANGDFGDMLSNSSKSSDSETSSGRVRKQKASSDSDSRTYDEDADDTKTISWTRMDNEDYTKMIEGNLTKQQTELVLARLPDDFDAETDNTSMNEYLNMYCYDIMYGESSKGFTSPTYSLGYIQPEFKVDELNKILSAFSDYTLSQDNCTLDGGEYVNRSDGDVVIFNVKNEDNQVSTEITSAFYYGNQMEIEYLSYSYGAKNTVKKKKAYLKSDDSDSYRIDKIIVLSEKVDTDNVLEPKISEPTVSSQISSESKILHSDTDDDIDKFAFTSEAASSADEQEQTSSITSNPEQTTHQDESQSQEENDNNNDFSSQEEEHREESSQPAEEKSLEEIYAEQLSEMTDVRRYMIIDIDNDGIKDLIVQYNDNRDNVIDFLTYEINNNKAVPIGSDNNASEDVEFGESSQGFFKIQEGLVYQVTKSGLSVSVSDTLSEDVEIESVEKAEWINV